MSCGCNGHISNPNSTQNPTDWLINPYGTESSDRVYYTKPWVYKEHLNTDAGFEKSVVNMNKERVRRGANSVGVGNNQGELEYASDFNALRTGLINVYDDGTIPIVTNSRKITASDVNKVILSTYNAGKVCLCNCNYCGCNCNACICDCNYNCTCNCNYSDITLKTEIEYI